jgi:hypothetical protein
MLFLLQELYANTNSEKAKKACCLFPAHSNQRMYWQHCKGVGSLAGYMGEAVDEPPFSLAFVMVKESFVIPAILYCLASNANKREGNKQFCQVTGNKCHLPLFILRSYRMVLPSTLWFFMNQMPSIVPMPRLQRNHFLG